MTDELIRKSDALAACAPLYGWSIAAAEELEASIEALPAVTVGVTSEDIDALAYRFWSIHPKDIPDPVGMPERYKGGARAWFYATEIRRILAALTPTAVDASQAVDPATYNRGYEDCLYQRGDAPEPAAIRKAAAVVEREIEQAKQLMPMVVPILRGVHRDILALITKGAAE